MNIPEFRRIPEHLGVIPDGNRRWAHKQGMDKEQGYLPGVDAGFEMYQLCLQLGIEELTFYGFTQDNTKRPKKQRIAFQRACVEAVLRLTEEDAQLRVVGNSDSDMFPKKLKPFSKRRTFGRGQMKVNFLVNYDWSWDLHQLFESKKPSGSSRKAVAGAIGSHDISRIDLIIRWGGRRRLSGFLPVQSVYADVYVEDALWPDFQPQHMFDALKWYQSQDITLGG